jgi:hypothetical protein
MERSPVSGKARPSGVTRRQFLAKAGAGGGLMLLSGLASRPDPVLVAQRTPGVDESVVVLWNQAALQGVRDSKIGPPMVARALAIIHTSAYDAWAVYDAAALGTRYGRALRRPPEERTAANKRKAISFAAYRAAVDLFPGDATAVFQPLMRELGYDPADVSTDAATPAGVGNLAARAILDYRHRDGANQLGDEPGGVAGVPYSDYTAYRPENDPMDLRTGFDVTTVHDPNRWQPLRYVNADGALVTQSFLGAQWPRVVPFALTSAAELSFARPEQFGSPGYLRQAQAVLELSADLTEKQKVIAEYWADGPRSELPPGHWNLFAEFVSQRDGHGADEEGIDRDVKLFFTLTNALLDASICCWENKRTFDSERPITALRYLFRGHRVGAWAGPYRGTQLIDGEDWSPYQPSTFPAPPFPEHTSGHSTFSAAGAEVLKLFTGSDRFGGSVTFPPGSSRIEPGAVPSREVTLRWDTFSQAAEEAGLSRRYGGIHFERGDLAGRAAGRLVGLQAWARAQAYFLGLAPH